MGQLFEHLRRLPPTLQVAALRDGMAIATDTEREPLAFALIEHAAAEGAGPGANAVTNEALGVLAEHWASLPPAVRAVAAAAGRSKWGPALDPSRPAATASGQSGRAARRMGAARVFESTADPSLAPVAAALCADEDRRIARTAERALLMAAERAAGIPGQASGKAHDAPAPEITDDDLAAWIRAIADAVWTPQARPSPGALVAALVVLTRADWPREAWPDVDRLGRLTLERGAPPAEALRRALRRAPFACARAVAWRYLHAPALAAAAVERLASSDGAADQEPVLTLWPLGLRPARRRVLKAVTPLTPATREQMLPKPSDLAALAPEARVGLVHWADSLELGREDRETLFEPLLCDPDPRVRLHLARSAAGPTLRDLTFDAHPAVARLAFLRWSTLGLRLRRSTPSQPHVRTLSALTRSPHGEVRAAATREAARQSAPSLRWRRRLSSDRGGVLADLTTEINSGDASRVTLACGLVARLGLEGPLEEPLLSAAGHAEPRIAATAVRRLARIPGERAASALHAALTAGDDRVRANALEAIDEHEARYRDANTGATQADAVRTLTARAPVYNLAIEHKGDPSHRLRANAVRVLVRAAVGETTGDARAFDTAGPEALIEMLTDARPGHRAAGAWVAQRSAHLITPKRFADCSVEVARLVRAIAHDDAHPPTRQRANAAHRRLQAERAGAAEHAA